MKKQKRIHIIAARFTPEERAALRERAEDHGISDHIEARNIVIDHLRNGATTHFDAEEVAGSFDALLDQVTLNGTAIAKLRATLIEAVSLILLNTTKCTREQVAEILERLRGGAA